MVDKRTALLDAAEAVLVEQGLTGATIDQITARAGVAKGTFYLYFRSKDEVVGALQQRLWDGLINLTAEAAQRMSGEDDWWLVADAFLETVVDYDIEHREWHRMVAQGWNVPLGADVGQEQQMIDLLAASIRDGVDKGWFDVEDIEMTATLLYRAVEGTTHQCCLADTPVDRDRLVAALKWFIRRVLPTR